MTKTAARRSIARRMLLTKSAGPMTTAGNAGQAGGGFTPPVQRWTPPERPSISARTLPSIDEVHPISRGAYWLNRNLRARRPLIGALWRGTDRIGRLIGPNGTGGAMRLGLRARDGFNYMRQRSGLASLRESPQAQNEFNQMIADNRKLMASPEWSSVMGYTPTGPYGYPLESIPPGMADWQQAMADGRYTPRVPAGTSSYRALSGPVQVPPTAVKPMSVGMARPIGNPTPVPRTSGIMARAMPQYLRMPAYK